MGIPPGACNVPFKRNPYTLSRKVMSGYSTFLLFDHSPVDNRSTLDNHHNAIFLGQCERTVRYPHWDEIASTWYRGTVDSTKFSFPLFSSST